MQNLSRILPTPLVFISGYANTENVFYCLNSPFSLSRGREAQTEGIQGQQIMVNGYTQYTRKGASLTCGWGGGGWTVQDMTSLMCELGEHYFLNKDWRQDLNAVKPALQRYQRAKAKCLYYKDACTIKKEKAESLASLVPKRTV